MVIAMKFKFEELTPKDVFEVPENQIITKGEFHRLSNPKKVLGVELVNNKFHEEYPSPKILVPLLNSDQRTNLLQP